MSEIPRYQIICGDAVEELKKLPDESIQMSMCSPPYWGLRNYLIKGQYGLEKTPQDYINNMRNVFKEVYRVLKKDGTCWVNIGDTYCSAPSGNQNVNWKNKGDGLFGRLIERNCEIQPDKIIAPKELLGRFDKQKYGGKNSIESGRGRGGDYKDKCMLMMPERFAFMMIDLGYILRNKIVWFKRNAMPSSVKDRFTCCWEYVYFFSKSRRYYFDLDSVRIPCTSELNYERPRMGQGNQIIYEQKRKPGVVRAREFGYNSKTKIPQEQSETFGSPRARNYRNKTSDQSYKVGGMRACPEPNDPEYKSKWDKKNTGKLGFASRQTSEGLHRNGNGVYNIKGKNPTDHWDITTRGYKGAHFAVYPEELCLMPIKAGSKPGDIVLDPFAGACTTCLVAKKLGRNYIGIDLNPDYVKMGEKRILKDCGSLF